MRLLDQLRRAWLDESQGSDVERAYRRGHNAGVRTAIDLVRVHEGLRELAAAPAVRIHHWPFDLSDVDVGGEG